ncbi:hypothetical protein GQ464_003850 [Rhodocaloribacter litoris]|uniref:hypothetical protein n=1 Tax=Rhodocaloribacter litoris TaxID=2558931 RepID=UPI00142133D6|nr:hypothetical protein [Rhodocaloribacter litoris]QXD16091.1 hypothetical protein GQ464_003850 [Rhodocaloribacter litoris]
MEKTLTRAEVEARLKGKDEAIARRLDAIKAEVAGAGASLRKALDNPLVAVGAMLAGGLLLGWMLGGRRTRRQAPRLDAMVLDALAEVIADEAVALMEAGASPEEALHEVLRRRAPVVLVRPDDGGREADGVLRSLLRLAGGVLTSIVLRNAIEVAVDRLGLHLPSEPEEDGRAGDPAPEA